MTEERVERRLAAILAADVAGYSRLMGQDETGTRTRLRSHIHELIEPTVGEHAGRIVKTTGDGLLIEFPSVAEAVGCALDIQRGMSKRNSDAPPEHRIIFRIGLNLGDVIVEDDDIHGEGVNIAARLESLAEPGEICISGLVYEHVQRRLDCIFEDIGEQNLKNISRPVRVYRLRFADVNHGPITLTTISSPSHPPLPDKPSIAVLPFQNMSGDAEQEYFADGMVEEIITGLSRVRWLFVIARNSSFVYKGRAVDIKQVGRELGVRYVLEGSVRKGGNRVRITAQLIDTQTGAHLWADRFEGEIEDIFELQDRVAISVAGVIEPTLVVTETLRSWHKPTTNMSAYDLYLRAFEGARAWTSDADTNAIHLVNEALKLDPNYGAALGLAASLQATLKITHGSEKRQEIIDLARRAIRSGANDPAALVWAAHALGLVGDDIDIAISLIDRALEMHPSYAIGWYRGGWLQLWSGRNEIALEHFQKATRLSPIEMPARVLLGIGISQFFAGSFEVARSTLRSALNEFPNWPPTYRFLAACCAHMGQLDEAREIVAQLRSITPALIVNTSHWRNAEQRELFTSGLRLAIDESLYAVEKTL